MAGDARIWGPLVGKRSTAARRYRSMACDPPEEGGTTRVVGWPPQLAKIPGCVWQPRYRPAWRDWATSDISSEFYYLT